MKSLFVIIGIISLTLFGCLGTSDDDKKEEEETHISSGLKGKIVDSNGDPVSGAIVRINTVDFVPSFIPAKRSARMEDTTNSDGIYEIPDVDSGSYNIEAVKENEGVLIDSVEIEDEDIITDAPDGEMEELGSISGITLMSGQNDTNQVRVTLYIPGTNRITKPIIGGSFSFENVPAGQYQMIIDPTFDDYNVKIMEIDLSVGENLDLGTVNIDIYEPDTIDITSPTISGVWGPNKTYNIKNDVEISESNELRILEGTKVIFHGPYNFITSGNIFAKGSDSNQIIFTHNSLDDSFNWNQFGKWSGALNADTIIVNNCVFERFEGINIGQSRKNIYIEISNSVIRRSEFGVTVYGLDYDGKTVKSNVRIVNNIFHTISSENQYRGYAISGYTNYTVNPQLLDSVLISNNIATQVTSIFRSLPEALTPYSGDYNCYFDYVGFSIKGDSTEIDIIVGQNDVMDDPLLTSIELGKENYQLQSASPCKGTGINGTDMGIYSTYVP